MCRVPTVSGSVGLAQGFWGGTGSWLGVIVCLVALICQSIHLGDLRRELSLIQKNKEDRAQVRRHHNPDDESFNLWPKEKRDLAGRRRRRHNGKHALLHLVPASFSSPDAFQDVTYISWKVSLHEGKAFELQRESVRVKHSGVYYIYSQGLYTDITFTMGQLVTRRAEGESGMGDILLRCVQSMPQDKLQAYNTCYSAGVFRLQKGDVISLVVPRYNASVDANGYSTFFGLVKL
ncbi:tumor necrosis factor ligand superfamily member 13 [Spea bombifrons]|uniref:tumor necrosis factor ligand superfamily member 13 n=1 Tax=Spea bombifrons TaxID=233779 RepID=UPI00234B70BC|nr:tumor necrosis factor ligand superfamily member 13 [Spea bombifrons]